jgi:hypothetical protein
MSDGVDPARIHSMDDLKAGLDTLRRCEGRRIGKDRLSIQDLARRMSRGRHGEVPRSTLANYLAARTLPPPAAYESILLALNVPGADISAWATARDRLDDARKAPATEPEPEVKRRSRRKTDLAAVAGVVVLAVVAAVMVATLRSEPPATPAAAPASECAYSPVAVPIRVRPSPSFGTGSRFQTISKIDQVVIGACAPRHAESGTTCSAPTTPVDTWTPVRFPYQGWVFSPCLERIAPPSPMPR